MRNKPKRQTRFIQTTEPRNVYCWGGINETIKNIQVPKAQKIYVVGNVGTGKLTFARELAGQTNFKNIDLDHFFQIYRQEKKSRS